MASSEKKTRRKHERITVIQEQLSKTQAIVDASLKVNPDMLPTYLSVNIA